MEKITQEQMFFYKLYRAFREDPEKWVSIWEFVGELEIEELKTWVLMSYKTPTNGSQIFFDNPDLVVRRKVTGKSGAKYYQYRLAPDPSTAKILDPKLLAFYQKIRARMS